MKSVRRRTRQSLLIPEEIFSMRCRQWVSLTLVMIWMASPVTGTGILYPTDSEARTVYYLDGIWNFRPANESDPDVGHREGWYKQELRKVSIGRCFSSFSDFKFLYACRCTSM